MIASISNSSDSVGLAQRPALEELSKRRELQASPPTPAPSAASAADTGSAVVEISREGARRAAQADAQPEAKPRKPPPEPAFSETPVSTAVANAINAAPAPAPSAADSTSTTSSVKRFKDADSNQDGRVSNLEARAYDFKHPSIPAPQLDGDVAVNRSASADVKAYEAVARSGKNGA